MRVLVPLLLIVSTVVVAKPKKTPATAASRETHERIRICDNVIVQGRDEPKLLERTPPHLESLVVPPTSFRREPPEPLH